MNAEPNHFKLGLFVIAAVALAVVGIVVLGAGAAGFERPVMVETYLDETVQGLDRGSPVKQRGVQIGRVSRIDFVRNKYPEAVKSADPQGLGGAAASRYILIEVALDADEFPRSSEREIRARMEREVGAGLRLQLAYQGITGLSYLEANYFDPSKSPPLDLDWEPEGIYVPSTPALLARIGDSAGDIVQGAGNLVQRLERMQLERLFENMQRFTETLTDAVARVDAPTLSEELTGLVQEVRATNARILEALGSEGADSVAGDARELVSGARRTMDRLDEKLPSLLDRMDEATGNAAAAASRAEELLASNELKTTLAGMAETAENLGEATARLPATLDAIDATLKRLDRTLAARQDDLASVGSNLRVVSDDLRGLVADLRRDPARMFFGEAPPPARPGRR